MEAKKQHINKIKYQEYATSLLLTIMSLQNISISTKKSSKLLLLFSNGDPSLLQTLNLFQATVVLLYGRLIQFQCLSTSLVPIPPSQSSHSLLHTSFSLSHLMNIFQGFFGIHKSSRVWIATPIFYIATHKMSRSLKACESSTYWFQPIEKGEKCPSITSWILYGL